MDNEKLFDLMTRMYSGMQEEFKKVNNELSIIKGTVVKIENDHGQKLQSIFEAISSIQTRLERIEQEV